MNWKTLLQDFRGNLSWGRVFSLVCLVMAVWGKFSGMPTNQVEVWLKGAFGTYGMAKFQEALTTFREKVKEASSDSQ